MTDHQHPTTPSAQSGETPKASKLEDLLCPVHASLDKSGKLTPFDNCIACIRNERDELREEVAALSSNPRPDAAPTPPSTGVTPKVRCDARDSDDFQCVDEKGHAQKNHMIHQTDNGEDIWGKATGVTEGGFEEK